MPLEECIEKMLKRDSKYCHQFPHPIYPYDGVIIKVEEENVVCNEGRIRKLHKNPKIKEGDKIQSSDEQSSPAPSSTQK